MNDSFAIVFPGQGYQEIGMLNNFFYKHKIVKDTFEEASSVLNFDLWNLIQKGPKKELKKTKNTQPALLTSLIAMWRIWIKQGGKMPKFFAGHSLGEYAALVCSDSLSFTKAVNLVRLRGKIMQEAVPEGIGAMSAIIGLDKSIVSKICIKVSKGQVVNLANFNTPEQIVISGHKEAVKRACIACKKEGAKYIVPLSISVPSHCLLMKSCIKKLNSILKKVDFLTPKVPIINNVDVNIENNPINIKKALLRQIYKPVRWVEIINFIYMNGVKICLEIGPKNILTKLNNCINKNMFNLHLNHSNIRNNIIK